MGLLGLLYNPFLIFIALFVWIGASAEAGMEQVKSVLSGSDVRHAMLTDFQTLSPGDPLSRAIDLTMAGSQTDFPVLEGGVMVGVLGQGDLLKGLQAQGEQSPVSGWMQQKVQNADIHEPLEAVMERLQSCECRLISITDAQVIVGIINLDNIMELVRIQSALMERSHAE
jgi:predicted transcriptional regulator